MRKVITPVNAEGRAKLGLRAGDTVRVVQNIVELKKGKGADKKEKTTKSTRKQTFEGLVLSVKHGREAGARRLVLTHYSDEMDPVWAQREAVDAFGGPVEMAVEGEVYALQNAQQPS